MKIGPLNSMKMLKLLLEIKEELQEIRETLNPELKAKKEAVAKKRAAKLKAKAELEFKE